jgi:predicted permease
MTRLAKLYRAVRALFYRNELEEQLSEELRFHLDCEIEKNLQASMSPEEARYAALREFGGVEQTKEKCRDAFGIRWLEDLTKDIRFGVRRLAKNPRFLAVATLSLALGIGANTAIFSVINAVLLRPLPFPRPEQLVSLNFIGNVVKFAIPSAIGEDYLGDPAYGALFDQVSAYSLGAANLSGNNTPERVRTMLVTREFFQLLGGAPILGRTFIRDEMKPPGTRVAILNYGLWKRNFGGEVSVLQKTVHINGKEYQIVGVMPLLFQTDEPCELWLPMSEAAMEDIISVGAIFAPVLGRLKEGISFEAAQSQIMQIRRQKQKPASQDQSAWDLSSFHLNEPPPLQRYWEKFTNDLRQPLLILMGTSLFVLLIAAFNVANLLLAQTLNRQKEISIRASLGAGRLRLARQLLAEGLLLSLWGGFGGLILAKWALPLLLSFCSVTFHPAQTVKLDGSVLGFTLGLSILTGVVFSLVPSLRILNCNLHENLKEGAQSTGVSTKGKKTHQLLAIFEMSVALVLLIGAGLLIRSFHRLTQVNLGFQPHHLVALEISMPSSKFTSKEKTALFMEEVIRRLKSIPEVEDVGATFYMPARAKSRMIMGLKRIDDPGKEIAGFYNMATPHYFHSMGISFLQGRDFSEQDHGSSAREMIINQHMARHYWPNQNPVGKRTSEGEIIGVVSDCAQSGPEMEESWDEYFLSYGQHPIDTMNLAIRTRIAPSKALEPIRQTIRGLDPELPVDKLFPMEEILKEHLARRRFLMILLGSFAGLALVLALVGIYGVISFNVTQQTHEIGVRMALGADQSDVLKLFLKQVSFIILFGIGFGILGASALMRMLKAELFKVTPLDPLTFVAVSLALVGMAILACIIPVRQSVKVDPVVALRQE